MKTQRIPLVILGAGTVGRELISQITLYGDAITGRTGYSLVPVVVANSTGALIDLDGLNSDELQYILDTDQQIKDFSSHRKFADLPSPAEISQEGLIIIDVTASSQTDSYLKKSLDQGAGVVLANKIPLTGTWEQARVFFESPDVRYECTAGAGLPLIETINYLLDTGDQISVIEGCLSGTLGYLCTKLEQNVAFSDAVLTACELGYAEPDPRIDLSGKDVARKALILARTAGWLLTEEDLPANPLFTTELADLPLDSFLAEMKVLDVEYSNSFESASANQNTLRYTARITPEGGKVGLTEIKKTSPIGSLQGPENYIALQTNHYDQSPIIISGPGAGPAVTAAGVLGDIIKLAQRNDRG
jgi:homoserine dehydrogenase